MPRYRLYHRIKGEIREIDAETGQKACEKYSWDIKDVWVRRYTPMEPDKTSESGHKGGGWKDITPRVVKKERT